MISASRFVLHATLFTQENKKLLIRPAELINLGNDTEKNNETMLALPYFASYSTI